MKKIVFLNQVLPVHLNTSRNPWIRTKRGVSMSYSSSLAGIGRSCSGYSMTWIQGIVCTSLLFITSSWFPKFYQYLPAKSIFNLLRHISKVFGSNWLKLCVWNSPRCTIQFLSNLFLILLSHFLTYHFEVTS